MANGTEAYICGKLGRLFCGGRYADIAITTGKDESNAAIAGSTLVVAGGGTARIVNNVLVVTGNSTAQIANGILTIS